MQNVNEIWYIFFWSMTSYNFDSFRFIKEGKIFLNTDFPNKYFPLESLIISEALAASDILIKHAK